MANYQNLEVSEDTIFVTGLPDDTTEEQLGEFFGQIGVIKFDKRNQCPKIWIYKDKTTGKGKGEATITFDDPPTATSAISWFDGKFLFAFATTTIANCQVSIGEFLFTLFANLNLFVYTLNNTFSHLSRERV